MLPGGQVRIGLRGIVQGIAAIDDRLDPVQFDRAEHGQHVLAVAHGDAVDPLPAI